MSESVRDNTPQTKLTATPELSLNVYETGISPRAQSLMDKLGISAAGIRGSGPKGRIIEQDMRRLA